MLDGRCGVGRVSAQDGVATAVNRELVALFWQVGHRIRVDLLDEERAPYGQEIVATLSRQLAPDYGRGFGRRNLYRMVQFAEAFPDLENVSTLSARNHLTMHPPE